MEAWRSVAIGIPRAAISGNAGRRDLVVLGWMAAVASAYLVAGRIGLAFSVVDGNASPIWPPAGIAVAALVVGGWRLWPGVLAGAVAVGLTDGAAPPVAAVGGIAAVAGALVAAESLRRAGFRPQLDRLADVPSLAFAGILGAALGATLGVAALTALGPIPVDRAPLAWMAWWVGDALAIFVVGGFLVTWSVPPADEGLRRRPVEGIAVLTTVAVVSTILFFDVLDLRASGQSVAFPIIPVVILVAFRAGPRGTALAAITYSAIAIVATERGLGPFVGTTREGSLLYLVAFMALVAVTGAAVAAVVAERQAGLTALEEAGGRAREALRQLQAVEAIGRLLAEEGSTPTALSAVVSALSEVFGYTHPSVYLGDEHRLTLGAQRGYAAPLLEVDESRGVMGRVMRTKRTQFLPDVTTDPDFLRADSTVESEISVPLLSHGSFLGVLNVESRTRLGERDLATVSVVADRVAAALALAHERERLAELAVRDGLTGLYNRRHFDDELATLGAVQARTPAPRRASLAVILFDLDHFGDFNKRHGHQVGDEVLRAFGAVLVSGFRTSDLVARYGGEEFVAVLPEATGADAAAIADRIREEFGSTTVLGVDGEPLHVTVSAGCSSGDGVAPSIADLIAAADVGLQMAKRAGRDLVVAA